MELWIRSQDKERLFKIDKLGIEEAKDEFLVVLYTDYDEWWRLGTYKSKERALEVLDEIQEKILKIEETSLIVNPLIIEKCVYEMPKK